MAHFLEALPFDFSHPGAQSLWDLLWINVPRQKDVMEIVTSAGVGAGLINWEQPMQHVWYDVLTVARNQDKLPALLEYTRKHRGQALAMRLDELLRAAPVVEAAPSRASAASGFVWHGGDEALTMERDSMLEVAFLQVGTERARAVVRLKVQLAGAPTCGTGFLIGPDLVLTNHHVLYQGSTLPDAVEVWFDYERGPDGADRAVQVISGRLDTIQGESAPDWAVIQLSAPAPESAKPVSLRPTLPLGLDDRVYIIQHPAGGPKKVSMHHNEVRYVDSLVVQYLTDTLPGSSGSPVFNERWEVVAVHHRSLEAAAQGGRPETRNQGIRIERILEGLEKTRAR